MCCCWLHLSQYRTCNRNNCVAADCTYHNIGRVGQNRLYTPYMTVYLAISLPKKPCMHRIFMVQANPRYRLRVRLLRRGYSRKYQENFHMPSAEQLPQRALGMDRHLAHRGGSGSGAIRAFRVSVCLARALFSCNENSCNENSCNENRALFSCNENRALFSCNENSCNENSCNEDSCNENSCNEDSCNEDSCNEDSCNENSCNENSCNEDSCNEDSCNENSCNENNRNENSCNEDSCNENSCNENRALFICNENSTHTDVCTVLYAANLPAYIVINCVCTYGPGHPSDECNCFVAARAVTDEVCKKTEVGDGAAWKKVPVSFIQSPSCK